MKQAVGRKVFGHKIIRRSKSIEVYERLHVGYGDGVMLRPAIIENMKLHHSRVHVLHIHKNVASIFEDIKGLVIVPIIEPYKCDEESAANIRSALSQRLIDTYDGVENVYRLSSPCADYETVNAPFTVSHEENPKPIPTGKVVRLSRQQIFCDVVGVEYNPDNYNVSFSKEESQAMKNVKQYTGNYVGVQIKSSTPVRDYKRIWGLVDYLADRVKWVVAFCYGDDEYRGTRWNVTTFKSKDVRQVWSVISGSSYFVGVDSFGVHAAACLGIWTYGIFGPTDPKCRLLDYTNAVWNSEWKMPVLSRCFKRGCGRQYCWYTPCKARSCLNARSPRWYYNDIMKKSGGLKDVQN